MMRVHRRRPAAGLPADRLLVRKLDLKRIGIIRASNRYGRFGVREIRDSARRLRRPDRRSRWRTRSDSRTSRSQLERFRKANLDAVVHWGDAVEGASILNQMREMGMTQPFYACDRTVSDEFVKIAGTNAEGVVAGLPLESRRARREARALPQGVPRALRGGARDLRGARLRRHEHADLGDPGWPA